MLEEPEGSRLFIVCGNNVEVESLREAFQRYGNIQNIRVLNNKGVAYVKYDRASSAAQAMEELNGAKLNYGQGPTLKVLLAEPFQKKPNTGQATSDNLATQSDAQSNNDMPPRSRLFMVVPKTAEESDFEDYFKVKEGYVYCKTDLVRKKGIAFCKFEKASQAIRCMEEIQKSNMVTGHKVKVMLAEPRIQQGNAENSFQGYLGQSQQGQFVAQNQNMYGGQFLGAPVLVPKSLTQENNFAQQNMPSQYPYTQSLPPPQFGEAQYLSYNQMPWQSVFPTQLIGNMPNLQQQQQQQGVSQKPVETGIQGQNQQGPQMFGTYNEKSNQVILPANKHIDGQRLFFVVSKDVQEEQVIQVFNWFEGLLHFELKRDKVTGASKGFGFVLYSSPSVAKQAIDRLHQMEYPPKSGYLLKVFYAEAPEERPGPPATSNPTQDSNHDIVSPFQSNKYQAGGNQSATSDQQQKILDLWKEQQRYSNESEATKAAKSGKSGYQSSSNQNQTMQPERESSTRFQELLSTQDKRAYTVQDPIGIEDPDMLSNLATLHLQKGPHQFHSHKPFVHRGGAPLMSGSHNFQDDLMAYRSLSSRVNYLGQNRKALHGAQQQIGNYLETLLSSRYNEGPYQQQLQEAANVTQVFGLTQNIVPYADLKAFIEGQQGIGFMGLTIQSSKQYFIIKYSTFGEAQLAVEQINGQVVKDSVVWVSLGGFQQLFASLQLGDLQLPPELM